jgi:pSer/pThr/pTyr-binding forkhead associated (FHA) protein
MNHGGKMDNQIFTLKNVLLHLTRMICLGVKEKSPNSNHDFSRGRTAAKKEEVIFDVNIINRVAPKEGLLGYTPPPKKIKKGIL